MPSAASVKLDKPPTNNSAVNVAGKEITAADNVDNSSPIRQVIVIIDHKIRNLEKRKSKLDSYRDIEKSGKELSADQKVAVSKYDEVAMTLDFAREFSKQIIQIATVSERETKKKQKKDETSKKQGETSKIREVLIIQDVLSQLSIDAVRKDFLAGANGACKLEENDLKLLDEYQEKVTPKRPTESNGIAFKTSAQKSADHFALTIDGKQKEFQDSTYANVKSILKNIQKCNYFDVAGPKGAPVEVATTPNVTTEPNETGRELNESGTSATPSPAEQVLLKEEIVVKKPEFQEAPAAAAVPVPTFPPQPLNTPAAAALIAPAPNAGQGLQQLVRQAPILPAQGTIAGNLPLPQGGQAPLNQQLHGGPTHLNPTTVRAVEQGFFVQQIQTLAEVVSGGNFFFLQDVELDMPDTMAQTPAVVTGFQPHAQPTQPPQPQKQPPVQQNPNAPIQNQANVQAPLQQKLPQANLIPSPSQSQIPSQTFTNQSFPTVVYTNIKQQPVNDITVSQVQGTVQQQQQQPQQQPQQPPQQLPQQQQPQIPGFAKPNAPIPIPILPAAVNTSATTIANNNPVSSASLGILPGKFVSPALGNASQANANILITNTINKVPTPVSIPTVESIEQRVPEISEWKPEDANTAPLKFNSSAKSSRLRSIGNQPKSGGNSNKDLEASNEWRDTFSSYMSPTTKPNQESNEWNGVPADDAADDSNTWSNQRYQYRQNSGRFNRGNRSDDNTRNGNGNGNNFSGNTNASGNTANGYRNGGGRSNSSYQTNGTYYQNGAGNNSYRDKPDNYTRPNSYRSRDNTNTFKSGGQQHRGGHTNSNGNNQNQSHQRLSNNTSRANGHNKGPNPSNGGSGGSGGGGGGSAGNAYRSGGISNNGARSQQQSDSINA